jgi:Ion channel
MRSLALVASLLIITGILWDAFETVVLPRRVSRRLRFVRLVFVPSWRFYSGVLRRVPPGGRREDALSYFAPLSLFLLLASWALALILGFGILQWGLGSHVVGPTGREEATLGTDLYLSGTTFFTLGLGDVAPRSRAARVAVIAEAGIGFAFLAMVITYVPVFYQAFSKREVRVALLDAWAGSPPTGVELIRRLGVYDHQGAFPRFLREWETWAAETLESHISFPALCFYRSQHDNQSWLSSLVATLDACALTMVGAEGLPAREAGLTFAMVRHVVVDLSQVLNRAPRPPARDRLPPEDLVQLREILAGAGVRLREGREADDRLAELRRMYEPYVSALSDYLLMPLPPWIPAPGLKDNWQKSRWK